MSGEGMPRIRLALGDNLGEIQAQSTYHFARTKVSDIDLVVADSPVIFEYTRATCRFVLPPALFTGISLDAECAVAVAVSPHLSHLTLEESLVLLHRLGEIFVKANWNPIPGNDVPLAALREIYADPQADDITEMGTWQHGDDEIDLTLKRVWSEGEIPQASFVPNEDLFIITVNVSNEKIQRRYGGY